MPDMTSSVRAFEAFNARFLTSEEVARTFIPPPQYSRLVEVNHTVLLGPRGSGKTTLLKMLQLRALAAWKHELADDVRRNIGYHSIFLGTDVLWGSQLESRTKQIQDEEKRTQIRRTSFRLHLSLAFLNSLAECRDPKLAAHPDLHRFTHEFSRTMEGELVRGLSAIWLMDEASDSILGIRIGLQSQLARLLALTSELRRDPTVEMPLFVDLDPVASVVSAIDLTNAIFDTPSKRWAILCDELEIAPDMIRRDLFQLLRSTSHNIIFKFSLFPYSSELSDLKDPISPSSGNDYTPLALYYGRREEAFAFCESMLRGMVAEYQAPDVQLVEEVLGDGWFDGGRAHRRARVSPYAPPNGQFYMRAQRLEKIDPSFRAWLKRGGLDIRSVHDLPENPQAPYRKALPYILTRSEFLRDQGKMRSRKSLGLYTGAYSLFSLTEGNPRVFINLMRPLVQEYARTRGTVGNDLQAQSADLTIHRFKSSLSAIPTTGESDVRSILQLIDIVGSFFRETQLAGEFSPEPASTFVVDADVSKALVELVGRALNAGAFVQMGDDANNGIRELKGARLRLAYTLAPEYKLPLVSGRSIGLSTILHLHRRAKKKYPSEDYQVRLPFGIEE
jgi:hypothetical protein